MRPYLLPLAAALLARSCHPTTSEPVLVEPGLQLFPSARAFDPPGQVIIVSANGQMSPWMDVSSQLHLDSAAETLPTMFGNSKTRAGLAATFLGGNLSGGVDVSRTLEFRVKAFGAMREFAQGAELVQVVNAAMATHQPPLPEGARVYVISETISADSIEITLSKSSLDSLGGKATVKNWLQAGGQFSTRDSSYTALVARLRPPQRVFYKVLTYEPTRVGFSPGHVGSAVMTSLDVTGELRHGPPN